jgi:outer membrane receptor for ferrienterochelin and colicin|tara:strand:- start:7 stop:306 length:300 start_codon:yes stop_codon:yes gene_type:complete
MFNGSLAYEDDKLFVRASLNFSDASADKLGDEKWEDRYYDDQLFIDLNANYSLSPSIKIFAEITNLTNQPLRYYQGVQSRTMQLEYYSYNWNIGVSIDL